MKIMKTFINQMNWFDQKNQLNKKNRFKSKKSKKSIYIKKIDIIDFFFKNRIFLQPWLEH